MTPLARCAWVAAIVLAAIPAYAQSLGELARQEEARRAAATHAAKKLSNADLRPQDITSPTSPSSAPAAESCYMSISKGRCVTAEEMLSVSNHQVLVKKIAPLEEGWRKDAASLRSQIEGAQRAVRNLEALAADQGRSASDRKSAERSLVTARQALATYERQWEKFETNAGAEQIPRAWIEPIPTLTTTRQSPQ